MDAHRHLSCFYVIILKVICSSERVLGLGRFFVPRVIILAVRWLKYVILGGCFNPAGWMLTFNKGRRLLVSSHCSSDLGLIQEIELVH